MSFLATKTNYVRPHAKASFIRPLCGYNENENMNSEFIDNFSTMKYPKSPVKQSGSLNKSISLKNIDEAKEKHLHGLDSAHSKLQTEIEKIQTWTTSIESEYKQKDRKVDELTQTVESQRKVVLDLQMQNENLSTQLNKEIQLRISVLEKFYFTKEVFSALSKKFHDLQGQFDACLKVKETVDTYYEKNAETIENVTKKCDNLSMQYSGNIVVLKDALKHEKHNNLILKDLCEQQNACAEKEHKSLCKLIENYQEELKNYSKDLESEKNKTLCLQQEKNNMIQKISQLENFGESTSEKLKGIEEQLKLSLESKLEIEKNFESEKIKVNDLNTKYEDLEKLSNNQQTENEEKLVTLNETIISLEKSLSELRQKLGESEGKNMKLVGEFQEKEKENNSKENKIEDMEKEIENLQRKMIVDGKISDELTNQLMCEKNDLNLSLSLVKDELQIVLSDKEVLTHVNIEKDRKLSEVTKDYEIAISKIEELSIIKGKYEDTLKEVEKQEAELQLKSDLLSVKVSKIEELSTIKEKYEETLKEVEKQEAELQLKSDLVSAKDAKLKELSILEGKHLEVLTKIKELEEDLLSKNELLILKEHIIEEMNVIQQNYDAALSKIKVLEEDIKHNAVLFNEEKIKVRDLNDVLKEKENRLDNLKYENLEMKDCLVKERESVKICLECEMLREKVNELDELKSKLTDTERELISQKQRTMNVSKMLSETEENFDEMRIRKEKEIIKQKDTIESLQHKLRILKVEAAEAEKLRSENEKLHLSIEEIKLQNAGDSQRLETENEKLKIEIENLKAKKLSEFESNFCKKNLEVPIPEEISISYLPSQSVADIGEKMEADSSCDEVTFIKEEVKPKSASSRNLDKVNKKLIKQPLNQSTPLVAEKRKRAWESESSGSECFEIVFDKDRKKVMGFTPKGKSSTEFNKTPISSGKITSSQDKKDIPRTVDKGTPIRDQNAVPRSFTTFNRSTPVNKRLVKVDTSECEYFLSTKKQFNKVNLENTPCQEKEIKDKKTPKSADQRIFKTPLKESETEDKKTPTSADRKFFKTPLKEREYPFKKPQLQKWWF